MDDKIMSVDAETMASAVNEAADMAWDYRGMDRQKAYYNAVGAAIAGMYYSPKMKESVFVEYRNSLNQNDLDTPLINNALDALEGACNMLMEPHLKDDLHEARQEKKDCRYRSCMMVAVRFLSEPETYLDNVAARHQQVTKLSRFWSHMQSETYKKSHEEFTLEMHQIVTSTNAEVLAAKLKTLRAERAEKPASHHAAIADAAGARADAQVALETAGVK